MKSALGSMLKVGVLALVLGAVAYSSTALAKRPGGGGGGCPRDILCADIYDPVICADGVIYGNACYAYRECATGCVPYGDGGPIEAAFKVCPRDINCPDVYDPVTCSNGVTYPNACYAYRACATGCGST